MTISGEIGKKVLLAFMGCEVAISEYENLGMLWGREDFSEVWKIEFLGDMKRENRNTNFGNFLSDYGG